MIINLITSKVCLCNMQIIHRIRMICCADIELKHFFLQFK